MKQLKAYLISAAVALLLFASGYGVGRIRGRAANRLAVSTDTIFVHDTLRDSIPHVVHEEVIKYITLPPDTIYKYKKDDIPYLPILQKVYSTPNYKAWVSGYNAALDSISIFPKTVYVTKKIPEKRFGIGITVGYGIGRNGLSPYVGIGGYYRIF